MTTQERNRQGFWQSLFGRDGRKGETPEEIPEPVVEAPSQEPGPEVEIAPNDPIVAYFASASGVVEIDKLDLDSPALRADRKSTRLNSSHANISYAVFCLKNKRKRARR